MKGKWVLGLALAAVFLCSSSRAEVVTLTSLDWCPYTCANSQSQGVTSSIVRAAFKVQGYDLKIQFLPWNRAVFNARNEPDVARYFPEYPGSTPGFLLSPEIGFGPLGLVESVDKPVEWKTVADLANFRLGVVSGYLNTPELDQRISAKTQPTDMAMDDAANIRKVGVGRIDAAVIDANVFNYLLKNDPSLAFVKTKVRMNPRLLEAKSLHIAFTDSDYGRKMAAIFAEGLKKIDVKTMQASLIHTAFTE